MNQIRKDLEKREKKEEPREVQNAYGEPGPEAALRVPVLGMGFWRKSIHVSVRLDWTFVQVNLSREDRAAGWLERGTLSA